MSNYNGPGLVTNGLLFSYDMGNAQKSWKGAPVSNLFGAIDNANIRSPNTAHFWNGYRWLTTNGYTDPGVKGPTGVYLGKVYKFTSGALSSSWSGNSYGYMLRTITLTASQYYAMSSWSYVSPDCNIDAIPASIESASSISSISGYNSTYNMGNKGTWQRLALSCVASSGGMNFIPVYPQRYGVTDGSFAGFFMLAMPQVETNTYPSVGIETTRSNTQAIVDLTGNNTITANSLTYNNDGSFSLASGNSATIQIPLATAFNKLEGTINVWIYPTSYNGGNGIFVNRTDSTPNAGDWLWIGPYSGTFYFRIGDGSSCCSNDISFTNYYSVVPLNTWTNLCCTWKSSGTSAVYINGAMYQYRSISAIPNTSPSTSGMFGLGHANADSYFNGKMPVAQIYNRQLTDAEVRQNFNSMRGRYGI